MAANHHSQQIYSVLPDKTIIRDDIANLFKTNIYALFSGNC